MNIPCACYSCPENVRGECMGDGCKKGEVTK